MPPTTTETDPVQAIQLAVSILAASAELHSAAARATELAIQTRNPTIIRQTTALMRLMRNDLLESASRTPASGQPTVES